MNNAFNFTIKDIAEAYRKTKVDLFYSGNPRRIDLAIFEMRLLHNLNTIKDAVNKKDIKYLLKISEGYYLCPKKIEFDEEGKEPNNNSCIVFCDPEKKFSPNKITEVDLRVIEKAPIAFHVITTLWINKVGERFDKQLSSSAYGNRIRRCKDGKQNLEALGTFNSYLRPYREWRDKGLKVMRDSLETGKKVVAITADFVAFYHRVNPAFIRSREFHKLIGIELNEEEMEFTSLIVSMLERWARKTPLKQGLPVGCSISAIIANAALALFDKRIESDFIPLYYGRYVDDIILVLENNNTFACQNDVWDWVKQRFQGLELKKKKDSTYVVYNLNASLNLSDSKGKGCELSFEKSKTKVFLLESKTGLVFLESLEHQIKERSSEWRALPELPSEKHIASMLLSASNKTGEDVDNLRKADSLSGRRAMFAMKLRNIEFYCRNLPQSSWKQQREAFLETIDTYFTNLDSFFDMFRYFPRIISIATECSEYDLIASILTKIHANVDVISKTNFTVSKHSIKSKDRDNVFEHYIHYIDDSFFESITASLTFPSQKDITVGLAQKIQGIELENVRKLVKAHKVLSGYDLANKPFRFYSLFKELNWSFDQKGTWATYFYTNTSDLPFIKKKDFASLLWLAGHSIKKLSAPGVPQAWLFPTRPFTIPELYLCLKDAFIHPKFISHILSILRGYSTRENALMPQIKQKDDNQTKDILLIQNTKVTSTINIALTSWKTDHKSLVASICELEDPDLSRYQRFTHLINQILASHSKTRIDYIVFPELSIPLRWFLAVSNMLNRSGISLIGGVEYIHLPDHAVLNQVWCSLIHDGFGFPQPVIVKHNKTFPAIHEAEDLKRIAGIQFNSQKKIINYPIVQHGDFFFGILICSELTNIDSRAMFRGYVDAIFVPEWNSDIEMFGSFIEASAYDVHAYIIQCNNRLYGDTRIRIPAKIHYNRDIVKIKGGDEDYFVVGKIDVNSLRKFQSFSVSPTDNNVLFKPVPAGFQIAPYRKCLPLKNDDE